MSGYTVKQLEDAPDVLGDYPGEMRMLTETLGSEQVAFTWRRMPPDTGGRGSYGHFHNTQEEVYFVADGELTFKCGDDEFKAGRGHRRPRRPQDAALGAQRHRLRRDPDHDLGEGVRRRRGGRDGRGLLA